MIWINFDVWSSYKFSSLFKRAWVWKRFYKKGYLWTPFIFLEIKKINCI